MTAASRDAYRRRDRGAWVLPDAAAHPDFVFGELEVLLTGHKPERDGAEGVCPRAQHLLLEPLCCPSPTLPVACPQLHQLPLRSLSHWPGLGAGIVAVGVPVQATNCPLHPARVCMVDRLHPDSGWVGVPTVLAPPAAWPQVAPVWAACLSYVGNVLWVSTLSLSDLLQVDRPMLALLATSRGRAGKAGPEGTPDRDGIVR